MKILYINYDNFLFIPNDMTYFTNSINEKFYEKMKLNFQNEICDIFEEEYRLLDIRHNLWFI
jgi:hypothetical protein